MYDEKSLYAMNKTKQEEILSSLGLSKQEIQKLNSEKIRIDKILELQSKSLNTTDVNKNDVKEKLQDVQPVFVQGKRLKTDLTTNMKKGQVVSIDKYNEMKSRGINVDILFE